MAVASLQNTAGFNKTLPGSAWAESAAEAQISTKCGNIMAAFKTLGSFHKFGSGIRTSEQLMSRVCKQEYLGVGQDLAAPNIFLTGLLHYILGQ